MKKTTILFFLIFALVLGANAQVVTTVDSVRINNANGVPVDSGTLVSVTGTVYGPNAYPTQNGNVFMLKGTNLSIKVYSKGTFQYHVTDGDVVTVVGTSSTYHGTAEINLSYLVPGDTIIKLSSGTISAPTVVAVIGEANESALIQVNNVNVSTQTGWTAPPHITGTHPGGFHDFNVHIGSLYLFIDSFMSPDLWNLSAAPTGIYNIVGFGTQYQPSYPYNAGYSLQPRSLNDFHIVNGISEVNNLTAAVYPNPASTKLTVTFSYENQEAYTTRIIDMAGRVVLSENGTTIVGDNTMEYNTSALSNGLYILEVRTATKALTTKISISK